MAKVPAPGSCLPEMLSVKRNGNGNGGVKAASQFWRWMCLAFGGMLLAGGAGMVSGALTFGISKADFISRTEYVQMREEQKEFRSETRTALREIRALLLTDVRRNRMGGG